MKRAPCARAQAVGMAVLAGVLAACGERVEAGPPIETALLEAEARLPVPVELVDEVRFVANGGDGGAVLVVRTWPHVRGLAPDGTERPGRSGRRAGQPWGGHAVGDSLWIFDTESWALWSMRDLSETARGTLPARTIAATHGCGERLVAIFAGGDVPAAELASDFGLRAYDSGAWWTLSSLTAGEDPAVYTGSATAAVAVLPTGEIALFNGARARIDLLPCGPYGQRTVELPHLAREPLPPHARGMAQVGGVLIWFWGVAASEESETRVGYWAPGRGARAGRRLSGNVRLYGGGDAVWLLDVSAAELIRLEAEQFLSLLR